MTRHQFRHVHWYQLNGLNVPVNIAQVEFGHASFPTTLNIHVVDAWDRQAIEARLFGESDANGRKWPPAADPTEPTSYSVH